MWLGEELSGKEICFKESTKAFSFSEKTENQKFMKLLLFRISYIYNNQLFAHIPIQDNIASISKIK